MAENYQKIAFIGLRNKDGSYQLGVPIYVKVTELNKNGMTDTQEEVIHKISSIVMKYYSRQLSEFAINKQKQLEGAKTNG